MNDPEHVDLGSRVLVRVARISSLEETIAAGEVYLNREDRERATRFKFSEDRARFVLGRALLGKCLEHHLGYRAQPVELTYSPQGRPLIPGVEFSISHARDLVAVALSIDAWVGIDLEYVRVDFNCRELAERIFSAEDLGTFLALTPEDQPDAFFCAWTGKEACLKACGVGIAQGITQVSVPLRRQDSACPITNRHEGKVLDGWRIQALPLPGDYMGNVVWNDPSKQMDFRLVDVAGGV